METATAPAPGAVDEEDDGLGKPPAPPAGESQEPPTGGTPPTPPADLPDDDPDAKVEQKEIPGLELPATRELGIKVGGRKPDSSVLKLKGCKIELGKGQYDRGDRFLAVSTLQVTGDNTQDTIDTQGGEVKSTSKAQSATVCGIATIEDFLRSKIESRDLLIEVFEALDLDTTDLRQETLS